MRKQHIPDIPESLPDEATTELLELTCDELDGLSRAFEMISALCEELQAEVDIASTLEIPENEIH